MIPRSGDQPGKTVRLVFAPVTPRPVPKKGQAPRPDALDGRTGGGALQTIEIVGRKAPLEAFVLDARPDRASARGAEAPRVPLRHSTEHDPAVVAIGDPPLLRPHGFDVIARPGRSQQPVRSQRISAAEHDHAAALRTPSSDRCGACEGARETTAAEVHRVADVDRDGEPSRTGPRLYRRRPLGKRGRSHPRRHEAERCSSERMSVSQPGRSRHHRRVIRPPLSRR